MKDLKFVYDPRQRSHFRDDGLGLEWAQRYPQIFDAHDIELLKTEHQRKYHFFEWLSAVMLFESTGLISLVEKYTCSNHPRKIKEVLRILPEPVSEFILNSDESGSPDLLTYSPTNPNVWFFVEVKGTADKLRPHQLEVARELFRLSGREVCLLELEALPRFDN